MSQKSIIMLGLMIGSAIGGYLPLLWGASLFSYSSLFGNEGNMRKVDVICRLIEDQKPGLQKDKPSKRYKTFLTFREIANF